MKERNNHLVFLEVDVTTSLYFASINVITHVEMMTCYNIIFVQHSVLFLSL